MQQISPYGKIPPHSVEIEKSVLGAMLVQNCWETVSEIITEECFYTEAHQEIFIAIKNLVSKNNHIDLVSVVEQLSRNETLEMVGGAFYVSKLTDGITSSVGVDNKCRIIKEKHILRELIRITGEIHNAAYEDSGDAFSILDEAENKILQISNKHLNNDYTNLQAGLVKVISRIEELRASDENITGVPTGFKNLDSITHGWQPTDLIILAARPSVGKTAFALNLAKNASLNDVKKVNVGFFSLEMSTGQLINRLLSCESDVWLDRLLTGKLEDSHMDQIHRKGVVNLGNAKMFIDDSAGLNIFQLKSKARRMVNKDKVGLIIIDYLQLMTGEKGVSSREQQISNISRELKVMAKNLKVPVIALSQLSREVEKRSSKVPQLSDLRESGAIEQDADMVMFLYRPDDEDVKKDADLKGTGTLGIKKHRNGSCEDLLFKVNNNIQRWTEVGLLESYKPNAEVEPSIPGGGNWKHVPKDFTQSKNNREDDAPF